MTRVGSSDDVLSAFDTFLSLAQTSTLRKEVAAEDDDGGFGYRDYGIGGLNVFSEYPISPDPNAEVELLMDSETWQWLTRGFSWSMADRSILPLVGDTWMLTSAAFHTALRERLTALEILNRFNLDPAARSYIRAAYHAGVHSPSVRAEGLRYGIPVELLAPAGA